MPAPAVYVLAVVSTVGAVYAFHRFVYEPHLAPKLEQLAEEFLARRHARRMQQEGPIPVPASIPLRRRRRRRGDSKHSDTTLSDSESHSDSDTFKRGPSGQRRDSRQPSGSFTSGSHGADFNESVAREVGEWRTEVGRSQTLRHRTNVGGHVMDESINPIPHPTMSPTHVIFDISASTTPTMSTVPSTLSSPSAQVSPLLSTTTQSTLHPSPSRTPAPLRPSSLSQARTPLSPSPHQGAPVNTRTPTSPLSPSVTTPVPDIHSPPSFSSPIPSLSQSYPQELDREHGIELLSPPSSGTSSPFTTFSPLVASQALSLFAVVQPLDRNPSPEEVDPWSPNPTSRSLSPSQQTITDAEYRSLPASPTSPPSELPSLAHITREQMQLPSQEDIPHPTSTNFTSPHALSPRSPHSDLSDLDFGSDFDVISDQGSEGSGRSWAGISSGSGPSNGRR